MSNAILNNVYNHYLTAYAPKSTTQYDTHKKSELRKIYNSIVKLNKESPWYLDIKSKETQEYAVSIKENARQLHNTIAGLGDLESDSVLGKKTASSSNPDAVLATYIGDGSKNSPAPVLEISVEHLATGQENMGTYLPDSRIGLPSDVYSFDIAINDLNYQFQFHIDENESNKEVQNRLVRLINNADIGIHARLDEGDARSSIRLTSTFTGLKEGKDTIFTVSDDHTEKRAGAVEYFGLAYTTKQASNSSFTLNGQPRSTASNTFTVGQNYEIELVGETDGEIPVSIGLKTDVESLTDNVSSLIGSYNSFVSAAGVYTSESGISNKLTREMGKIASLYQEEMNKMGIRMQPDRTLAIDEEVLKESASSHNGDFSYDTLKNFANALVRKTSQVSLNPMEYVDRTIAAYKNPGKSFANPYVTSSYSGMIFNSYC
ncbi:MAG: flagellar filament capping protein FliD [Lachnospiraceae bacterium]